MASLLIRVVLGGSVVAALIAGVPGTVEAQPAPEVPAPTDADKLAAKGLVDEGLAAMDARDYDRAIELYKKAFALVPHPILLFNIAQSHRLAGRPDRAMPFYERYLQREPNGSEAAAAREWLAQLRSAGVTPRTEDLKPAGTGAPPAVGQDVPPPIGATTAAMPALQPAEADRTDTVARPGRTLRLTGIALGAAGLVGVGLGGYYTMKWRDTQAAADRQIAIRSQDGVYSMEDAALVNARYAHGFDQQRRQDVAYIVGGTLIVGGAVTYWLGYRKDRAAEATAWAPVVGPGFTGIAFSGSLP